MAGTIAARREIVRVCRRLYERGLIAGQDGNVSVRLASGSVLVTPAGLDKVELRPEQLVELSPDGARRRGRLAPSSEVAMHLRIYHRRPDVGAIVHAHPPTATGFAAAGETLPADVLPELIVGLGSVPLVPYAMPGTEAVPDGLEPYLTDHDVFLLANHGATAVGPSLPVALRRMESLEHSARILLTARLLGRVTPLGREEIAALVRVRQASREDRSGESSRAGGERRR